MANRVYIGRLSSRATERDVEHFFRGYGKLRDIVLKNGFGFIEFDSSRDADDAIYDLNGKELAGERVMLEFSRRGPRADQFGGRGGGGGRDSFGARGGSRYGPPTKTRHRMIVENLSTHISWQDLKDMCRKYGEVTFADAHREKKNEGMICFASRDDLKHCMDKMDGKDVNGRKIKLIDDSDDRGNSRSRSRSRGRGRSGSRSRSRSPRSRSRSPRGRDSRSRSRSKGSRSPRRDEKSRSRSRSGSPKRDKRSRSATPKKRDDKSKSRSRSRSRSRSGSAKRSEKRSRSRSASREASRSRSPADRKSDKENSRSPSPEKMDD